MFFFLLFFFFFFLYETIETPVFLLFRTMSVEDIQLWLACSNGKVVKVRKLLQSSQIDINWQDSNFLTTPLCVACMKGHIEVVKLLLNDERVDINKADIFDQTSFWAACHEGHIEIVKFLLNDERVDVNKASEGGRTPFLLACYFGRIEIVKLLLNDPRVDLNKANNDSQTPFYVACQEGHIDIVEYLLACGREIDFNKINIQTLLDLLKYPPSPTQKFSDESEEQYPTKSNYRKIVELIESFNVNPIETRTRLRIQLGFAGNFNSN